MIRVRMSKDSDRTLVERAARARELWVQDPMDPLVLVSLTAVDGDRPVAVLSARRTVDLFLSVDPDVGTPRSRWKACRALAEPMRAELHDCGIHEAHMSFPPQFRSLALRAAALSGADYDLRHHLIASTEEARP